MEAVLQKNASTPSSLHDRDFYAWTLEQSALLKAGKVGALDLKSLAEELEDMSGRERRELQNRLRVLLMHLLKWQFQPDYQSNSWRASVVTQREEIQALRDDSPSLVQLIEGYVAKVFETAVLAASGETGLPLSAFPSENVYSKSDVLNSTFWPESRQMEVAPPIPPTFR